MDCRLCGKPIYAGEMVDVRILAEACANDSPAREVVRFASVVYAWLRRGTIQIQTAHSACVYNERRGLMDAAAHAAR